MRVEPRRSIRHSKRRCGLCRTRMREARTPNQDQRCLHQSTPQDSPPVRQRLSHLHPLRVTRSPSLPPTLSVSHTLSHTRARTRACAHVRPHAALSLNFSLALPLMFSLSLSLCRYLSLSLSLSLSLFLSVSLSLYLALFHTNIHRRAWARVLQRGLEFSSAGWSSAEG